MHMLQICQMKAVRWVHIFVLPLCYPLKELVWEKYEVFRRAEKRSGDLYQSQPCYPWYQLTSWQLPPTLSCCVNRSASCVFSSLNPQWSLRGGEREHCLREIASPPRQQYDSTS